MKKVLPQPGENKEAIAHRLKVALSAAGLQMSPSKKTIAHGPRLGGSGAAGHRARLGKTKKVTQGTATCKPKVPSLAHWSLPLRPMVVKKEFLPLAKKEEGLAPSTNPAKCSSATFSIGEPGENRSQDRVGATVGSSAPISWGELLGCKDEEEASFRPSEFLGAGSFANVYGGHWKQGEAVAVKVLQRDPLMHDPPPHHRPQDDRDIAPPGMEMEILALKHLAHPCIVQLRAVIATAFNVQLYLRRHETCLHNFLQQRPPEAQAKQIAYCVTRGLAYMHGEGFVHRDLKPANILVDRLPLAAVISDLGSAHLGEDGHGNCTTLTYRAPEIMLRHPYGKAADVWSLGCTFLEVEQPVFFAGLLRIAKGCSKRRAEEYLFMSGLVRKLRPTNSSALTSYGCPQAGVYQSLLQLGSCLPAPGVVGWRFSSQEFQSFMASALHFQPKARATAEDLSKHPWFQHKDELAIGSQT